MSVGAWLRELGLERYEQAFRDNDVDMVVLPELTADDLAGLGIASIGHRRKLLAAIARLRAAETVAAGASSHDGASRHRGHEPARQPNAERRQLTVMFADLVGSSELSARLDLEDLRAVIAAYQRICSDVIHRYEGYVAKYMGDGVLAYFGYPQAHEDDAERAVRAGLELVEAVRRRSVDGTELAVRLGIATGQVVVGDLIGEGAAQEEAVIGETPNRAARLQALAEPGSVVVDPRCRQLVGGLFEYADLGVQALKGLTEPVRAWRVLGEGRAESRFEALHGQRLTALVGREHEIGLLAERWERAKEGEGQVVLLSGEPGIGKSRIVRALRERLAGEPHMPLSHYCSPYHTNSALYPVISHLERAAGFNRDDRAGAKLAKLEALLARGTGALDDAVPLAAALLGIDAGARYPALTLSPQRQKQRTLEVLVDQVEGLAASQPVLAVYEDVHWVDPTTLEVLDALIERAQRLPVLVLITFRPEFVPPWTGHAHVMQLSLSRLTRRHGYALVATVTGGKPLPEAVLDQILAKTDGVPLFVEELTKAVLESSLFEDKGDHYALARPLPLLVTPATLQDSLMARLDRLGPAKEVAQIGAVLGREFGHDLLAAVAPVAEPELQVALRRLVASGLVMRRDAASGATYSFKHALIQDAAYQSLLRTRRREWHARIADVLEAQFADLVEAAPELIARHLTEAELPGRAFERWLEAGRRARTRSADAEAVEHLTEALRSLSALPEGPERDQQELDVQLNIGSALLATGGWGAPEVERAYNRAWELCERTNARDRLLDTLQALRIYLMVRGGPQAAEHLGNRIVSLAERKQDPLFRAEGHRALGIVAHFRGRLHTARDHLERALVV